METLWQTCKGFLFLTCYFYALYLLSSSTYLQLWRLRFLATVNIWPCSTKFTICLSFPRIQACKLSGFLSSSQVTCFLRFDVTWHQIRITVNLLCFELFQCLKFDYRIKVPSIKSTLPGSVDYVQCCDQMFTASTTLRECVLKLRNL